MDKDLIWSCATRWGLHRYGCTMTDPKQPFMAGVTRAAVDTPYVVTETADGFDLTTDMADPTWLRENRDAGTDTIYVHRVRVQGSAFRIISDVRDIRWKNDKPLAGRPRSSTYAHTFSLRAAKSDGNADGEPSAESDARAGRQLIEYVAAEMRLIQHAPGSRLGLLLTGVALLVTVVLMFGIAAWVLFSS